MIAVLDKSGNNNMAGYGLLVHYTGEMPIDEEAELLAIVLGYERTQAMSCAQLVQIRGSYLVKRFKNSEKKLAESSVQVLRTNGTSAELIRL